MASSVAWDRFIRYLSAKTGAVRWGEPIISDRDADIESLASEGKLDVYVLEGDSFLSARHTGEQDEVKELLGPLTPADVPMVRCVGINYMTHSRCLAIVCIDSIPAWPLLTGRSPRNRL